MAYLPMVAPQRTVGVVGLGYVGLPAAVALGRCFDVVGFDVNPDRVARLSSGYDETGEVGTDELAKSSTTFTSNPQDLARCDFFIVAVPTPITKSKRPDLRALQSASRAVGSVLSRGDIVVYESTVYPGVTEEVCGPILAEVSGLACGEDFTLGYSPERINPGDREHTFERVVKVVSGQDATTAEIVAGVYGAVIDAGVHKASSIRVAEASKVIENVQRDLNIALMNELAVIFDRMNIDTHEVLAAAGTKWNFLKFVPGLVGGHCIGVDPYYLTAKAEELGISPQVILAGRRINDGVGHFVARSTMKEIGCAAKRHSDPARVLVLGLAFKEDVRDLRNSRVPDIVAELQEYGAEVVVHDPLTDAQQARHEYGIELVGPEQFGSLDAVILAVPHQGMRALALDLATRVAVVIDVKSVLNRDEIPKDVRYWRL